MVRSPAVAGSFYPNDKNSLINQINDFLDQAEKVKTDQHLSILIVPHAGYDYSGPTASWGFKQIESKNYTRVIILGASHQAYFQNAAVYNQGSWQTPLGKVKIDEDLASILIKESKLIEANLTTHQDEHSLEVELPFLQQALKNFKIVPVLLGQTNNQVLEDLAQAVSDNFDQQTLLIISSDLSHYPNAKIAKKVDQETIDSILTDEVNQFSRALEKNTGKNGVDTCACGAEAIKVGMLAAKKLGADEIKLFNYSNSGDTGGDKDRVVGYAAIGFYGNISKLKTQNSKPNLKSLNPLNKKRQEELLTIARGTLESYLKNKKIPEIEVDDPALQEKLGAFVTLTKNGQLRGCIGEFEPEKPLYQVVQDKTIDAAFHDPRFSPLTYKELKEIEIEISILSPKKKIDDWKKIKLGEDGVIIKQGLRGGTFLPQVAEETGWDLETFLSQLCSHKAGLSPDCYQDPQTEIYVFQAQVFKEK
jgi:AmmeMemoRadiSam system protein B/AmmeMemoRadiSam system protein A